YSNVVDFDDWLAAGFCVGLAAIPVAVGGWATGSFRSRGTSGVALFRRVGLVLLLAGIVLATVSALLTAPF
ncbi:MAG: hypothetical protein JWP02_2920, partial [Acidimicrobiales bacterium]|nr:hypothetical protein [Acidimicrobiales bacterium]